MLPIPANLHVTTAQEAIVHAEEYNVPTYTETQTSTLIRLGCNSLKAFVCFQRPGAQ